MVFFEGALGYEELRNMPLVEVAMLQREAERIHKQRK